MEVAEQHPDVPDGWAVVAPNAPGVTAPSAGTWEDRGIAGKVWHPASGAKEENREDNSILGMPPEFAALSGMAIGRAIGAAGLSAAGRAVAGLKATASAVTPVLKYEATKTALQAVGVNPGLATVAATIVAGYKKGAKAEPAIAAEPIAPSAPAAPVEPVASGPVAPAPPVAAPPPPAVAAPPRVAPQATPEPVPSPVAPPPATMGPDGLLVGRPGGNPDFPDQKSLNEAALAVRRAAYQARMSSAPPVEPAMSQAPAAGNVKLSAAETKAFLNLIQRGVPGANAMKSILAQRAILSSGALSDADVAAEIANRVKNRSPKR